MKEDDLWWKTTFEERRPLLEDNLWRKRTFDERGPLMEDDLWRKTTTFGWKTTFDKKKYLHLPILTATVQLTPNRKSYQPSIQEIKFHMMEEMYAALRMCNVHVFINCLWLVYYLFMNFSLLFMTFSLFVCNLLKTCSRLVHDLLTTSSWLA